MIFLRNLLSVLIGLIICNAVFGIFAVATMFAWPEYWMHGHRWLDQRIFSFTPIMASLNLFFWMLPLPQRLGQLLDLPKITALLG
jgi:hypothetical protein